MMLYLGAERERERERRERELPKLCIPGKINVIRYVLLDQNPVNQNFRKFFMLSVITMALNKVNYFVVLA